MQTKPDLPKYRRLRKMGDDLYLIVPRDFVRAHALNPNDEVIWSPGPDDVRLKFIAPHPCPPNTTTEAA